MNPTKTKLKIILTNWISVVGIFLISYLSVFIWGFKEIGFPFIFISALILIVGYGMMFWVGFITIIFILDFIFFYRSTKYLHEKLFAEWLLIITPFIYWIFDNKYPFFIILIIAFAMTQYIRKNKIVKILENNNFEIKH